jgi:polyisoprenyl-phosphate glycosyltransferase
MQRALFSVVVPAFNEEASIGALIADLRRLMVRIEGDFEVLVVDDGSSDDTFAIAQRAASEDSRFRTVRLSRNFGHQAALSAGIARATGDAVITMDADGQHPVPVVAQMVEKWRQGYDVVYGVMTDRPSESWFKRTSSDGFYRLLDRISDTPMPRNAGDFRLMDRQVVDHLLRMPERHQYLRGMVSWLGFRQVGVPYSCEARHGGASSYTLARMTKLAGDALFSFSTWPLRAGLKVGLVVSLVAILLGFQTIGMRLLSHTVPGWATIVVVIALLGGVQLIVLGVIGEYVGRIYEEVKARPLYATRSDDPVRADLRTSVMSDPVGALPGSRPVGSALSE